MRHTLVILLTLAACTPGQPRWTGENLHVVDGYWVDAETACRLVDCRIEVAAAMVAMTDAERDAIVSASLAGEPRGYISSTGESHVVSVRTPSQVPSIVIFDLADGRRRVVTLICTASGFWDGRAQQPTACRAEDLASLRVDRKPGFEQ
jgi:hypothetical protein